MNKQHLIFKGLQLKLDREVMSDQTEAKHLNRPQNCLIQKQSPKKVTELVMLWIKSLYCPTTDRPAPQQQQLYTKYEETYFMDKLFIF